MRKFLVFLMFIFVAGLLNFSFGQGIFGRFFKRLDMDQSSSVNINKQKNSKELIEKNYFNWLKEKYAKEDVTL